MTAVHHRYADVGGHWLFYREAGPADAPVVVLLHGFPTGSFMFRNLIPLLAGRFRVIAPDHLGFGLSDAPPVDDFDYTFDALADLTARLLDRLGITRFALHVQGCGAPIGRRVALADPEAVTAIVSRNGNACEIGFTEEFWRPVREYRRNQNPGAEAALRQALTLEAIRWQYLHGVPHQSLVSPDNWYHDHAMISRRGNDLVQLRLLADHASNLPLYPRLHTYLRDSQVPLPAIWGRDDEIFRAEGALAFTGDAPHAEIHLLGGGRLLLETHLDTVAATVSPFLETSAA